jgi:23S rRNA G2445 N2-methylase RlmL
MKVAVFADGYAVCADSTQAATVVKITKLIGQSQLVICNPPYGNVVAAAWDKFKGSDTQFSSWMVEWSRL